MKKIAIIVFMIMFSKESFALRVERIPQPCSVCGHEEEVLMTLSGNSFGARMYLDSRIHGPMVPRPHLATCSSCNLVSYNISTPICDRQAEIVNSENYQEIFKTDGASMAYVHLLKECGRDNEEIASFYLRTAWGEDDKVTGQSVFFRKLAIPLYEQFSDIESRLVLLDLYRQTQSFDKATELLSNINIPEDNCIMQEVIKMQRKLIANENSDPAMLEKDACK